MLCSISALLLAGAAQILAATSVAEPPESTIQPAPSAISAARATATASSPVSNVKGIAFDRFYQIWLENTDYTAAAADPNQKSLAAMGITLTNYWGVTHPSEPNYIAAVSGDYYGMENDDFHAIPTNVSTVVDLLDTKGISWGEYQEGLPYAGYTGFNYTNQQTGNNSYVRKHNPLIIFDSVAKNATRLSLIKNFTSFSSDLSAQKLPQWAFFTPNMTNDGHDTNVSFTSTWEKNFLAPLINNTYFWNNTLILLTFDEIETYPVQNKVFSILIGGAIPASLKGTTDNTFYNHYSTISTVAVNWGLPSLGRWDCEANVFALVANKTGYTNAKVDTTNLYFNSSYPGPLSDTKYVPKWPAPNTQAKCASGLGVLSSVKSIWGNTIGTYNYTNAYPYDTASNTSVGGTPVVGGSVSSVSGSSTASGSASGTASGTPTKSSAPAAATVSTSASAAVAGVSGLLAVVFGLLVSLL